MKILLWDIDGTLLNFLVAERAALDKCFEVLGLGKCTDEMVERYSAINRRYWERLERGEISKEEVLVGRYEEFFALEGLPVDKARAFNDEYQVRLGDTIVFCDNSDRIVWRLKDLGYRQYIVTNGTAIAQKRKIENSGLGQVMDGVFISDEIGVEKPGIGFFDYVFDRIGKCNKDEVMIIGDSLTSDMQGGNNAGIKCCFYNPDAKPIDKPLRIDYNIQSLEEIFEILGEDYE